MVENRGGGGGDIAMNLVAKAPPDGKTVLLHTSSHVINPTLRGKAMSSQAFEPIAASARSSSSGGSQDCRRARCRS